MIPELFHIGPIPVNSFGLMIALAVFAAVERLSLSFKHNGLNPRLAEKYVFTAVFGGLVAARLWYIGENWKHLSGDLIGAVTSSAGFTFYGGFIVSTIILIIMSKRDKIPVAAFVDSAGPTLALGYAIGRIGCQLAGDGCYGVETESFLSMAYTGGVIPTAAGVQVFPTPFIESTVSILMLFILLSFDRRDWWQKPYSRFSAYLVLLALERFSVEFFRRNIKVLSGFSEAQVIAFILFSIGVLLFIFSRTRKQQELASTN